VFIRVLTNILFLRALAKIFKIKMLVAAVAEG